ncbi:MAG: hypothetical protein QOH49_2705 [Acidobacteriota bacterium]|jgi:xylan 1,4-beta-xylosidase|nr:hypothetical protein [Acidobacteriota bacterium]
MFMNFGKFVSAALCAGMLLCVPARALTQNVPARVISADYRRVKGPRDRFPLLVVGAGRAAEGLRADWQRDQTWA